MAQILIVDDDRFLCRSLCLVLEGMGHTVMCASTLGEGRRLQQEYDYAVVILDVWLPDGNGLEALQGFRTDRVPPEIIILTGAGDPDGAELAIRSGAWSYITKPPTLNKFRLPVQRAVESFERRQKMPAFSLRREGIVGESSLLVQCLDVIAMSANTESPVLIAGETGTGKELFARAIHVNSNRAEGPFVVVDCGALTENLVESTLFGHERGAFTGADKAQKGLIQVAHGGTLFLDEVGELPLGIQKTFLRVLQEKRFRPVGGTREAQSDFRLVAATNRDLDQLVTAGGFRQDLVYRLKSIQVDLPPLRRIKGDIEMLCCHYVAKYCNRMGISKKGYSAEFLDALLQYEWPGNVRELVNCVAHCLSSAWQEPTLFPRHLPTAIRAHLAKESVRQETEALSNPETGLDPADGLPPLSEYRQTEIARVEQTYLQALMAAHGADIATACEVAGLSRARLYALLKHYGISREGRSRNE
ncbi:sigma-54-dependent transcriptional regulator [Desulfohalobium retbaense]|uniref:Two component, sigma54 specific, transcriptional regulator, Fis family n=1 Tax=Desulfohalobium retbaense (strain ATCC 49708 / DSM 5692 / JCM 16813 / HR100) TaxID=485915 RepID=C8X096_DESRD|nr:sigma-54 dependent transcriptional regulator [Desulfohalobium retbaense]ACV67721.1 putative two component, sigma54 specific, transcriptional regulator, Fis family [Desulfohalobium retbaense DSM 5692]